MRASLPALYGRHVETRTGRTTAPDRCRALEEAQGRPGYVAGHRGRAPICPARLVKATPPESQSNVGGCPGRRISPRRSRETSVLAPERESELLNASFLRLK